MKPELSDVLAALPDGDDPEALVDFVSEDDLRSLLNELSRKPAPTGRLTRAWSVGSLQARLAMAYLYSRLRGALASDDEKQRVRNEFNARAALKLLGVMGHLRGALMKVGQTMASMPTWMPEDFIDLMGKLHFEAPPMHFSLLREKVRGELGGDPEEVFAEFETQAFAAASLGQVHRASLPAEPGAGGGAGVGGADVAVKIQYPNIARTIEADFRNLTAAMMPMRLRKEWTDMRELLADMRDTLLDETDYVQEADYTDRVRQALGPQAWIGGDPSDTGGRGGGGEWVVPRVHRRYSSRSVLTLDHVPGVHLEEYLASDPSLADRDRRGEQLARASMRLFYGGRLNLSDPHPGNVLFLPDGRLGLIDFGCMRPYSEEEWRFLMDGTSVMAAGNPDDLLLELAVAGCRLDARDLADPERMAALRASMLWLHEPFMVKAAFDFGDEAYFKRGVDSMAELLRLGFYRSMPLFTWTNRLFYGVRALLLRLRARVDMWGITCEELERAGLHVDGMTD